MTKHQQDKKYNNDNDPLNILLQPLESILIFLSTPIPSSSTSYALPLVYPLTIIALNLILDSWMTILLLDFLFIGFFLFARSAIIQGDDGYDDDGDVVLDLNDDEINDGFFQINNKILDLLALFGSVVSTAIISPSGFRFDTENVGIGNLIGLVILGICSTSGIIMNVKKWNDKYSFGNGMYDAGQSDFNGDSGNDNRNKDGSGSDGNSTKKSAMNDYSSKLISEWDQKFKELDSDKQ